MAKKRQRHTNEEKVNILRKHFIEKIPLSDICDQYGIKPTHFYRWQKQFFEFGERVFESKGRSKNRVDEKKIIWKLPVIIRLEQWKKELIIEFWQKHPLEGYRRCCYMMMDQNLMAVSPSSVYRVLAKAGVMDRWSKRDSKKGTGFVQPIRPHDHWHIDISYLNIRGTFFCLCSVLDGCSRYIIHQEIRESMKEEEVEIILQSNGKLERWHKTIKGECIRPGSPLSLLDARELVDRYIKHYNEVRLHSSIGYVAPKDKFERREQKIFKARAKKLEEARKIRQENWSRGSAAA